MTCNCQTTGGPCSKVSTCRMDAAVADVIEERDALAARLADYEAFIEDVASGRRGDCTCWVCELARMAQATLDATRPAVSSLQEPELNCPRFHGKDPGYQCNFFPHCSCGLATPTVAEVQK